nr:MAG TPA: hypothetical protein [Caudoviricetes sp.]
MNLKLNKITGEIAWCIIVALAYYGLLNLVCKYVGHTEPQLSITFIGAAVTVIVCETITRLYNKHIATQTGIMLTELHKFIEGENLTKYENFSLGYMLGHAGITGQEKDKIGEKIKWKYQS